MHLRSLRTFLFLFFILTRIIPGLSQISICTWNLKDLGNSKSDEEIRFIATTLKTFDVVAIQEVVAGNGGAQAVARLHDAMNRTGSPWDYAISAPTVSSSYKTERYAFFWKKSKITKSSDSWLEKQFSLEMDREPLLATLKKDDKEFTLVNFHAITKTKNPETEIKYLQFFPGEYPKLNLIFLGDFNLPQSHTVFNPLKSAGYKPALTNQKTSLRDRCIDGDCLASAYDNIFYNSHKFIVIQADIIHLYKSFSAQDEALFISDHVPVFVVLN